MKSWPTFALIAVGLWYALYFHLGLRAPNAGAPAASSAREVRQARPAAKPAPRADAPGPRRAFGGYPCRGNDCSDDMAGYRWAQANGIEDPDDCTGKTGHFIEGCRVYARQQTR